MKVLLIPSAVIVPREMRKKFGELPTALFPLGNITMLEHIIKQYSGLVDQIYVVTSEKKELIEDYVSIKKLPVKIIELDHVSTLGHTILSGITRAADDNGHIDYLYINFADSLLDESIPKDKNDFAYYATIREKDLWTYFISKGNKLSDIKDKNEKTINASSFENENKIFIGVFGINDASALKQLLEKYEHTSAIDPFYQAIYDYSEQKGEFDLISTTKWLDVGHAENYLKAKTNVAARAFNTINIDEERGILKKTSDNKVKLVNEISWYLKLPNKLQYLFPRIYDYSLDLSEPYVSMEYYGYHTLHELLVYGNVTLAKWQNIFKKLQCAISDMENYRVFSTKSEFEKSMNDIYLNKTFTRLDKIREDSAFSAFFTNSININGRQYLSLNEYIALLPKLVNKLVINTFNGYFNIIHGDLCFSNILIEDTYNFVRLIDPRGKFGGFDIYGDERYELAKLLHTMEGNYDFIIEDMFDVSVDGSHISFQMKRNAQDVLEIFKEVFSDRLVNISGIRLIEATLFLSMIPLHSDYPKRQYAMLATGIQLLQQVLEEQENEI